MRLYQPRITDAIIDEMVDVDLGLERDAPSRRKAKDLRWREYNDAKNCRPFWLQIQLTFTGAAGNQQTGFTLPQNHPLIVVAMSSNTDPTTSLISLQDSSTRRDFQSNPVPSTGLFGDIQQTTERYFRLNAPIHIAANSNLKLTVTDPLGTLDDHVRTFWFMCIWAEGPSATRLRYDKELDDYVKARIEEEVYTSPYIISMDVAFPAVGTASELIPNQLTVPVSEPVLIYAAQHNFAAKATLAFDGPQVTFKTNDISFDWSATPQLISSFADFLTEPEQWIPFIRPVLMRPNSQIAGNFINGTGGAIISGTKQVFFLAKRL